MDVRVRGMEISNEKIWDIEGPDWIIWNSEKAN